MNGKKSRQVQRQSKELDKIETHLQTLYTPVRPRSEYVNNLRHQLSLQLDHANTPDEHQGLHLMLVAASLLSGTFVLVLAVRGIINFIGGMHEIGNPVEQDGVAPANSV
jgi:hypothetical protein